MNQRIAAAVLAVVLLASACDSDADGSLTVYSGRNEELVGPLMDRFEEVSGIDLDVRYASSTELAATLREEGDASPADVFFAVDPASLGAVAEAGLLARLPDDILSSVPERFSDRDGRWVGTSGRSRVVVYDPGRVHADDLPETVAGFADPRWKGRLGIAPTNGSFLAFVAAMILTEGEDATRAWLESIAVNEPLTYSSNSAIVAAVDTGEVDAGLANHYYLLIRRSQVDASTARNHFMAGGDAGALVMPAGAGVLASSDRRDAAVDFVAFLLSPEAQRFFAEQSFEYPLVAGVDADPALPPLATLDPPDLDLGRLAAALDLATELVADSGLV